MHLWTVHKSDHQTFRQHKGFGRSIKTSLTTGSTQAPIFKDFAIIAQEGSCFQPLALLNRSAHTSEADIQHMPYFPEESTVFANVESSPTVLIDPVLNIKTLQLTTPTEAWQTWWLWTGCGVIKKNQYRIIQQMFI